MPYYRSPFYKLLYFSTKYKSSIYPQYTNVSTIFKTIENKDDDGNVIDTQVVSFIKARKIAQDELNESLAEQARQLKIDADELKYLEELVKGGLPYEKAHAKAIKESSVAAKEYAIETKGVAGSTDVFIAKQEQAQESLKATATTSKGATIAMQALATVGNMFIGWAISEVLTLASKAISDYINRLEISKEKLAETENELASVNSEFEETTSKIKELESLEMPSLTDKEDLERLRAENKELAIRKKYLEDQKKLESEDVVQYAKEKMDYNYGRTTSRESIDAYKAYMDNPTLYTSETDTTTIKIAQYEHYQELRKQALEDGDLETIDILDTKLKQLEESLLADRTELQGFKDDLSLTGEASPELDNVINKLEFIDDLLLAPSENLKNFLNSDEIVKDTAKLTELAYSGELTESQFKESFSKINAYLEENGLTFQDLISVLGIYRDELEGLPEGNKTAVSFSDQLSQVQTLSKGIEQLDEIMADVIDGESFDYSSILNNDDFKEVFGEYKEEYENFIKVITNSPDDISKCKDAFNQLAGAYIYGSGALENLTEESKDAAILELIQMGLDSESAIEAVNFALGKYTKALEIAKKYSLDLENQSLSTNASLILEGNIVEEDAKALFDYALQKELCAENPISTVEDCQALLNLAKQANATAEVLQLLIRLKNSMSVINSDSWGEATKDIARKEVDSIMAELKTVKLDTNLDFFGGSKTNEANRKRYGLLH